MFGGCSVQLAVLLCRVFGRDVEWRAMFQAAAGREPLFLDFEVVRPLLFLLPSHVAGVLAGSLGEGPGCFLVTSRTPICR